MQAELRKIVDRPTGALLVTGPTGSGKTTSLFAVLTELSRPEINIITVEDPVEYRLPGVNQVQVNARGGVTFATALRVDSPLGPRRRDGRRDPGRRDREDRDRSRADRPLRPLDAAHERRPERADATERDGRRAVPDRRRR